jgi:PH domain
MASLPAVAVEDDPGKSDPQANLWDDGGRSGVLLSGWLLKKGGRRGGRGNWKKRYFAVVALGILYYERAEDADLASNGPERDIPQPKGRLRWSGLEVVADDEEEETAAGKAGVFEFALASPRTSLGHLRVRCSSAEERKKWVRACTLLIELEKHRARERERAKLLSKGASGASQTTSSESGGGDSHHLLFTSSGFSAAVKALVAQLVDHTTALFAVSGAIIRNTRNEQYRIEFSKLQESLSEAVLDLLGHALRASEMPFDSTQTEMLAPGAQKCADLLAAVVRLTVRENKGRGGENAAFKERFTRSLQGVRRATTDIIALQPPSPRREIEASAAHLRHLLESANNGSSSPPTSLKPAARELFGLVNLTASASASQSAQLLPEKGMAVFRLVRGIGSATAAPDDAAANTNTHTTAEVLAALEALEAEVRRVFPQKDGPSSSSPPAATAGGQEGETAAVDDPKKSADLGKPEAAPAAPAATSWTRARPNMDEFE